MKEIVEIAKEIVCMDRVLKVVYYIEAIEVSKEISSKRNYV
ncbi:MAG: hypothetical protein QXS24_00270 [Desulfurococcaceae archaeon]